MIQEFVALCWVGNGARVVFSPDAIAIARNHIVNGVAQDTGQKAGEVPAELPMSSQLSQNEDRGIRASQELLGGPLMIQHYVHGVEVGGQAVMLKRRCCQRSL